MTRFSLLLALCLSVVAGRGAEPVVRMLVPGFTVEELPVRLSNINNLRFAPGGQLTALAYDGRVHLLRDANEDGLLDTADVYWDKQPLSVPVGMCWGPEGLYVSSHGKVSLLRDTNRDGKADTEEVIASGWPRTDVASGGVDASAITRDAEGNLYFALLVADYSNAYRLRKRKDLKPVEKEWLEKTRGDRGGGPEEEVSLYDTNSLRGTIQKWNAKTRALETLATGMRVPYALAFNERGDLFVTDQEGETWMPNGNPLDELNHIEPGRNYGFPPRHPRWLPNLRSEAPVVSFGPQHQSACGMVFNIPAGRSGASPGQSLFGPKWWQGDAFVAGESRGKIWRARMSKTPCGYVGQEQVIARLGMLATDLAISPEGDLYVSCHSGPPDWGTGPNGEGKIFRIRYTDTNAPQPALAYAASPTEARVTFDRILPRKSNPGSAAIEFGEFVSPADRFETLKPPYQVVEFQESTPRGKLAILSQSSFPGQIVLATAPHPQTVSYAATLQPFANDIMVDVQYTLQGVEAQWLGSDYVTSLCLPHLDFEAARELTRGSFPYDSFWRSMREAGTFTAKGILSLPPEARQLRVESSEKIDFTLGGIALQHSLRRAQGLYRIETELAEPGRAEWSLALRLPAGKTPKLHIAYQNDGDPRWRVVPPSSFLLPWAPPHQPLKMPEGSVARFTPGDWETGKGLFFGERFGCARCHRTRGEGSLLGPDLSNLISRDPASILRDIEQPSAMVNPDYVSQTLVLHSGEHVSGILRSVTLAEVELLGADGAAQKHPRSDVKEFRPSAVSLMPSGLLDSATEAEKRDLLTYLLHAPPVRKTETTNGFAGFAFSRPLRVLLVAGKKDHGPQQHDYPAWQAAWSKLLPANSNLTVTTAWEWPQPAQFEQADVAVFYYWNHDWSAARLKDLDAFLGAGKGVVLLHSACISDNDPDTLAQYFGLAAQPQRTKYRHGPVSLAFPATKGEKPKTLYFLDESYWPMVPGPGSVTVVATAEEEGAAHPMLWKAEAKGGRVFGCILGHYTWTWLDPEFHRLIAEGMAWAGQEARKPSQ